jgi:hypothetical protein
MKNEEHKLMIAMFTTQFSMYADLVNVLRDRGVLSEPELKRLWAKAHSDGPESAAFARETRIMYTAFAKILGLDLELDT